MWFFILLVLAVLGIGAYVKMSGKAPCGCHDAK